MPRWRRRRARTGTMSGYFRRLALGITFVMLGAFIIGALGYLISLVPDATLTLGSGTDAPTLSRNTLLQIINFFAGIFIIFIGMRKLGVRL